MSSSKGSPASRFFAAVDDPFRLLVESVVDYAIFLLDSKGHVQTWSSGAQQMKGYAPHEIIGVHFSRFYPEEAVRRGWPAHELREAARQGRFEDEGWRIRKDGSRFWANVVITALRDEAGQLAGFAKITRDLTEHREHDEALRRSEERFRLLLEATIDYAIFMLDSNGSVLTWNTGAERINGYRADEIIGQHFSRFYPSDVAKSGWPEYELEQATEKGRFEDEGWRIRKDGSRFWANVVITSLRDEGGHRRGFAQVTRDLTERKRMEELEKDGLNREALLDAERAARLEAQRAAHMKDEFLATVSHELRTPLHAILGWAQVFQVPGLVKPDEIARGVDAIQRNARAQVRLIDDLLDLSRIMGGRVRLDLQRLMLHAVVEAALDSAQPAAMVKGIQIEHVLDPVAGAVSGDAARLQQVVWNLLSNAIKFTPNGGRVQVTLERVNSNIELTVSDTGIGIAPEFVPMLFDRFSQQDTSIRRTYGGLGLGLAIAKHLVELHGGTLRAKSEGQGRGSSFTVSLPVAIMLPSPPLAAHAHAPLPALEGVRTLVVDDDRDALELATRLLEAQGAIVTAVASGEAAIASLDRADQDVLISDVSMPNVDGYQLIGRIRSSEAPYSRLPAVALTAFARAEDRKRALLAGYDSHLSKPVDIGELVMEVAALTNRTQKAAPLT